MLARDSYTEGRAGLVWQRCLARSRPRRRVEEASFLDEQWVQEQAEQRDCRPWGRSQSLARWGGLRPAQGLEAARGGSGLC